LSALAAASPSGAIAVECDAFAPTRDGMAVAVTNKVAATNADSTPSLGEAWYVVDGWDGRSGTRNPDIIKSLFVRGIIASGI
jgi:hypothetical protein